MPTVYNDIGPAAGNCGTCGREAYAIPGPTTVRLIMSDETDKVKAMAMWCPQCDGLFCAGCGTKCPKCGVEVHDYYNTPKRHQSRTQ